tara:strand:+ start:238 stop:711 length:474 start_codon:yes stop_codon:yes gene_type:complete
LTKQLTQIADDSRNWKNLGKKIVFTNGCFDLLHKGHLDLLFNASRLGDLLIVGLNSDNSVKKLKGRDRPVQPEADRKEAILNTKFVEKVYIFNTETPKAIIETLRPDYLVKGGDYKSDEIIGAEDVHSWGGKVKIFPLTPGYSTTKKIKKMRTQGLV